MTKYKFSAGKYIPSAGAMGSAFALGVGIGVAYNQIPVADE